MDKQQTRRDFLKTLGVAVASAGTLSVLPNCGDISVKPVVRRPNVILIMSDDHAAQALSCYGSRINKTPNLDRIAKEGMRFNNCFCTNSICEPSRAVILTAKYSHINGVVDNGIHFDSSQRTFPKMLQEAGYETAMIGKWHLKSEPQGFDYWNVLPGQGEYYNPEFIEMGERKRYNGYVTDIIADLCIGWLRDRFHDKPFCLLYYNKAPHRRWESGPAHQLMYAGKEIPEPQTFNDNYSSRCEAAKQQEMTIEYHLTPADLKMSPPPGLSEEELRQWYHQGSERQAWSPREDLKGEELKSWKYQRYIKDYLRCIASVDDNVGRLLDYLDESGLAGDTIVIYTSDQGFFLGEHGWFDKRFMYEESLRMPLLMRYPGAVKPGSVNDDIVLNLDFGPTILDFAGVAKPADMQGESFRRILQGDKPPDWRTSMYYHYYEFPSVHMVKRHYGIRTHRYKLIHFYHDIDAWELYDLANDPYEVKNVYGNPAYAKVVRELESELKRLRKKYGDSDELSQQLLKEYMDKYRQWQERQQERRKREKR